MDYNGSFNLKIKDKNLLVDKLFVYYLMEVKNNFPLENRITIEIDSSYNFEQMIKMSKKIKSKHELAMKKNYVIENALDSFKKIIGILKQKMLVLANEDEFEKAAIIKRDIKYIERKIKEINEIKEISIPYGEFIKNFHVN
jgi:excinuclease UvrABC nuclease subunit